MTTRVDIMNEGPDNIEVTVECSGEVFTLVPQQRVGKYVYGEHGITIKEIKESI